MHIDSYEFGRIVIDGRAFTQDIILLPEGIQDSWWRLEGHRLQLPDVATILAAKPEVLIVGQGEPGKMRVDAELAQYLKDLGVEIIEVPTAQACTTFNALCAKRRVAAALHLTC